MFLMDDGIALHCELELPENGALRCPLALIFHGFTGHMEEPHIVGVARAMLSGTLSLVSVLVEPLIEIVASLVLGVIAGKVLTELERLFHSNTNRTSMTIGFVFLTVALSKLEIPLGKATLGFSPLLVCMMLGSVFCNLCPLSDEIMERADKWTVPLFALFFVFVFLFSTFAALFSVIRKKRLRRKLLGGSEKSVEWFRGTPLEGNLKKASGIITLISGIDNKQNLISAYITRLFYKGAFDLVQDSKGNLQLKVNDFEEPAEGQSGDDLSLEYRIYSFFKSAAGDDAVIQKKELRKWASKNGKLIYKWHCDVPDNSSLRKLAAGDVRQVYGLKRFLKDFTLIPDRGVVEVGLWNNYLIFASLYGIAGQVYKDFKKVCPEYFALSKAMRQVQSGSDFSPVVIWDFIGDTSRYFNSAGTNYASNHMGSSRHSTPWTGGGGTMSWGGGGGSFGGGFGGGVR